MFTIRSATRVLFAAAVLAVIGTAQAAEKKPKSFGPQRPSVQEELKVKSSAVHGIRGDRDVKPIHRTGSGPNAANPTNGGLSLAGGVAPYLDGTRYSYKANHGKVGKMHGKE